MSMKEHGVPTVEQPIMVGFEFDNLTQMTADLLNGIYAAVVIRKAQYKDFEADIYGPIREEHSLEEVEQRNFSRKPVGLKNFQQGMRETVHLDVTDSPRKRERLTFPYTLTVSRTDEGKGLLVAAASSTRVKAWTIDDYHREATRLNRDPKIEALYKKRTNPGFNTSYPIPHKGLRSSVGAVHLSQGDVAIIAQGAEGSLLPTWHAIITQEVARNSQSYHTRTRS